MKTKKRQIKNVQLVFFKDDATGDWGLAHKETYNDNDAFNAFWGGIGFFHDVFEHSHEKTHKYFQGDYAMNIGGEMAAMGSMFYYIEELGLGNRILNSRFTPGDSMRETTCSDIQEAISEGYGRYGNTLECNVPKQNPTDNGELEWQIEKYWKEAQTYTYGKDKGEKYYCEKEKENSDNYKRSVTFRKIADLHRYGYRMAEKLVKSETWENRHVLRNFIEFWDAFTKNNSAEFLAKNFHGMDVKVYKDNEGVLSWKAILRGSNGLRDLVIRPESGTYSIEDDIYNLWNEFENRN